MNADKKYFVIYRRLSALICGLNILLCIWAHETITTKLTWSQEISRIVYKRCLGCHRQGGSAMPLVSYTEVRPWAKAIKEAVLQRQMPPWGAVKGFGEFADDASLTQDEITRIAEWVEGGAPEGDPAYLPAVPAQPIPIPFGVKRVRALKTPAVLAGVRPLSAVKSSQVIAEMPDGSRVPLIWLENFDPKWGQVFRFRMPVEIPRGARVIASSPVEFEYLLIKSPGLQR